tara:strand:- start:498 stop:731 length:234 start_codon:yes stop_codon:yes gene_type:complete
MTRQELKDKVSDHLVDMIIALEDRFDVEFDHDHWAWHELEEKLTDHLMEFQILSEEEIKDNELLNHADALSDESRGR